MKSETLTDLNLRLRGPLTTQVLSSSSRQVPFHVGPEDESAITQTLVRLKSGGLKSLRRNGWFRSFQSRPKVTNGLEEPEERR